jgi:hypothetical protein
MTDLFQENKSRGAKLHALFLCQYIAADRSVSNNCYDTYSIMDIDALL